MILTAGKVVEGLFMWAKANPWILKDNIATLIDPSLEPAARKALRALAAGQIEAYQREPLAVRQLGAKLFMDFIAQLMGPMNDVTWPVIPFNSSDEALQRAAWRVVEIELLRAAGLPAAQH